MYSSTKLTKLTYSILYCCITFITILNLLPTRPCQQTITGTNDDSTWLHYNHVFHKRIKSIIRTNNTNFNLADSSRSLVITSTVAPATQTPPVVVPDFNEPIGNHTVALGRDAQLSCKINSLGNFRTAWLRVEDKGILTIHNNIITRNYRIGLINNDDGKNFILTIKNVQPSDKGGYMCQINSVPMKYAIGYLDVLTPPAFDDMPLQSTLINQDGTQQQQQQQQTTTTSPILGAQAAGVLTVSEGGNASLSCRANGHPSPVITWRREDNEPILLNGASTFDGFLKIDGSTLLLSSVSRLNSGAYLCIASNGVQPSASKRQVLDVQFSPVIRLPQTEVSAQLGQQEAKLICYVELNPLGSYHWVKLQTGSNGPPLEQTTAINYQRSGQSNGNEDDISLIEHDELMNSDKFEIVMKQVNSEKVQMALTIRRLDRQDFAWYKCIARNSLGIQSNSIRLYETSSFSLNNMFRGSGSDDGSASRSGSEQPEPDSSERHRQQQQQQQQQQNDQQHLDPNTVGRPPKQSPSLSRAHTRSSWVQRSSSGRQQDPAAPTDTLLDSTPNSSANSQTAAITNLLLSNHLILLFHCILLASVAQIVVVNYNV